MGFLCSRARCRSPAGLGFRVQGLRFAEKGSGLRVSGLGFKVQGGFVI